MSCRSRRSRAFGQRLFLLAVILAGGSAALAQREAESLSASFRKAAERVLPSIVAVRPSGLLGLGVPYGVPGRPVLPGELSGMPVQPGEAERQAGGSGVVVDAARGLILTSDQAISGASRVVVFFEDGREVETDRVVRDPRTELAVLVVDPRSVRVKAAEWGSSEALQLGDWVLSVGRTSGRAPIVSAGIVSGRASGPAPGAQDDLLRTDAVIGITGSGGPLIDLDGRIVGINRARLDPRGWFDGLGAAIPAERARRCVSDLAEFGQVRRGYLGLMLGPGAGVSIAPPGQATGLVVTGVSVGSSAAEAGLRMGDRIVSLDGHPLTDSGALSRAVEEAPIGQEFRLTIERAGQRQEVTVASRQRLQSPAITVGPVGPPGRGLAPRGVRPRDRSGQSLRPVPPRQGGPVLRSEGPDEPPSRQPAPAARPKAGKPEPVPRAEPKPREPGPAVPAPLELDGPASSGAQPSAPHG